MLSNARIARQHAREKLGRNSYAFYSSDMNDESHGQMMLEAQLRKAIENQEEFLLNFQPKPDVGSGAVMAMEAPIRWSSAELAMVPPDLLTPIAETESRLAYPSTLDCDQVPSLVD